MIQQIKRKFHKWNYTAKCSKCKSTEIDEINDYYLDGIGSPRLEYDVVCANCGEHLNHYAYGHMEIPETKIEYIKWLWNGGGGFYNFTSFFKNVLEIMRTLIN